MGNQSHPDARVRKDLGLPDRYAALRHIASGGMASVWCARDRALNRNVAIKLLAERFADDEDANERFLREARAAARLSGHPNVVMIYDVGATDADGRAFIVMEFLAGGTVADAIRVDSVRRVHAVKWLQEAASALDFAHSRGVLHRDIKPANLLLDRDRTLHVADFGIARLGAEDTITGTGQVLGTASYLAPERAIGRARHRRQRPVLARGGGVRAAGRRAAVRRPAFRRAGAPAHRGGAAGGQPAQPHAPRVGRRGPRSRHGQAARGAMADRARFRPGDRDRAHRGGNQVAPPHRRRRAAASPAARPTCGTDRADAAPGGDSTTRQRVRGAANRRRTRRWPRLPPRRPARSDPRAGRAHRRSGGGGGDRRDDRQRWTARRDPRRASSGRLRQPTPTRRRRRRRARRPQAADDAKPSPPPPPRRRRRRRPPTRSRREATS